MNLNELINPRGKALKKWLSQLLADRYNKHDSLVERLGYSLQTDKEFQDFGVLAVDLFELGYLKCMNDYKSKLTEMGVKVSVVPERPKN